MDADKLLTLSNFGYGGVSIFGKYCKENLGGGSDKKFPQRKYQLLLYIKNQSESKKISTTEKSTFTIYKKTIYKKPYKKFPQQKTKYKKFPQRNIQHIQYIQRNI